MKFGEAVRTASVTLFEKNGAHPCELSCCSGRDICLAVLSTCFARWKKKIKQKSILRSATTLGPFRSFACNISRNDEGIVMKINIPNLKKNSDYIFGFKFEMEDTYTKITHVAVPISKITHVAVPISKITHVAVPISKITHVAVPISKKIH
jgi:hypothetical protein